MSEHILVIPEAVPKVQPGHRVSPTSFMPAPFTLSRSTDTTLPPSIASLASRFGSPEHHSRSPYGVTPRNIGQVFMKECLMVREEAPHFIIKGVCIVDE